MSNIQPKVTISGDDEFVLSLKGRINAIDGAIEELRLKRAPLVAVVQQYDPNFEVAPLELVTNNNDARVTPLDAGASPVSLEPIKSSGRGRSSNSLEAQILNVFEGGKIIIGHHSQVARLINKEVIENNNKSVRRALISLKERKEIASYVAQRMHSKGGYLVDTPLYGLTKIFSDPEQGILCPEYELEKTKALEELGFMEKQPNF